MYHGQEILKSIMTNVCLTSRPPIICCSVVNYHFDIELHRWLIGRFSSLVAFKEGEPGDLELNELAGKIGTKWNNLGLQLGIGQDVLNEIETNGKDRPYEMLLHWRNTTSSNALYRDLYRALCHNRVGFDNVAKEFCGKKIPKCIYLEDYLKLGLSLIVRQTGK